MIILKMAGAVRRLGLICPKNSVLFLCDMQEKFRKTIQYYPHIIAVSNRLLQAANTLNIPVVVTEQYPKGLGPTVSELDVTQCPVFPKQKFSMMIPEVEQHLKKLTEVKSVILCGIEAHVCVQQTVLDLLEKNIDVHVIVDASSSRSMVDRMHAFKRMREVGAFLTTSESMMLTLCGGSDHPKFKEIQKLIWEPAPDSGLLTGETAV